MRPLARGVSLLLTFFSLFFFVFQTACSNEEGGDAAGPLSAKPLAPESPSTSGSTSTPATWNQDVAPILRAHCQSCHALGEIGPFPLTTFDEAKNHHAAIANAVITRVMPPWLPNEGGGCQELRDARRLSTKEIDTIARWSAMGAPEGSPTTSSSSSSSATTTSSPATVSGGLAKLPWVDRVTDIGVDYTPTPADGPLDEWRCFVIDPELTKDETLIGYDLVPTVRAQTHHAGFVDAPLDEARARDDASPGPGWPCPGSVDVPLGRVLGSWAAGFGAVTYPSTTGMKLEAGRALVVQIHYHMHPGVAPTPDRTRIELAFAHAPVAIEARYVGTGVAAVSLPPRSEGTSLSAHYAVNEDATLWALQPHMHRLGVKLHVELLPSAAIALGTVGITSGESGGACLLDITRWNYHWEELHFLSTGLPLPRGSLVRLTCTWDNPTDRTVSAGLTLDDEMCDLGMVMTPR